MAEPTEHSTSGWMPAPDRLVMIAAGCLAACAAALALALIFLGRVQDEQIRAAYSARDAHEAAERLVSAWREVEAAQLGYLLTADLRYLLRYRAANEDVDSELSTIRSVSDKSEALENALLAAEIEANRAQSVLEQGVGLRGERRFNAQRIREQAVASLDALRPLHAANTALVSAIETERAALRDTNAYARAAIIGVGGVLAVLALITSVLTMWAIRQERRGWRSALALMVRANSESEIARQKSAESDLAKTRFLAAASHDMRQPLHALTLYLSALQRRVQGEEALGILAKMERATQSMSGMFSTLLDLARIQADVVTPEMQDVRLQDVIDRIVHEHPGADVKGPPRPTTLHAHTDPGLLERLLRNLVSNAMRHGGGSARIDVRAARDGLVEIAVIDKGPGIAPEDQARIFDEFVRLDGRAGAEGLGLGLAIVKRIAELIGAELSIESAPGEGARFIVRLPRAHSEAPSEPASAPGDSQIVKGVPILVMDDDPLALEAAAGALRDLGADVRACANEAGVDAALASGFKPRLLVMDLRIDGELAGVDIANRARAKLSPPPRVVMVTGDTASDTLGTLRESGHAWLIKPVTRDDLTAAIAAAYAEA